MSGFYDLGQLAARALHLLDGPTARGVDDHVAGCGPCQVELAELRETESMLRAVPPEALIEGPPSRGGDLVLTRALRTVRAESGSQVRKRGVGLIAASLVLCAGAGGAGVILGSQAAPTAVTAQPSRSAPVPDTRTLAAIDADSGSRMTVTLTPAAGWVRLTADVTGIPGGERCQLVVIGEDGSRTVAGGWLSSAAGERDGTEVSGSAAVAVDAVAAVVVENEDGRRYVTAPA